MKGNEHFILFIVILILLNNNKLQSRLIGNVLCIKHAKVKMLQKLSFFLIWFKKMIVLSLKLN